jgi:hypothetical protein
MTGFVPTHAYSRLPARLELWDNNVVDVDAMVIYGK